MNKKNLFLFLLLTWSSFSAMAGRDEVSRFWFQQDRLQRERSFFNRLDKVFFLDISGTLSKDLKDLVGDVKDATELEDDVQQVEAVVAILNKHRDSEFFLDGGGFFEIGFPKFKLFKNPFRLSFFAEYQMGASLSLGESQGATVDIPDLGEVTLDDANNPYLLGYYRAQQKYGLKSFWEIKSFVATLNLYTMIREDRLELVQASQMIAEDKAFDFSGEDNKTMTLNADLGIGYRFKGLKTEFRIEELRVAQLSEDGDGLVYGNHPLYRLHTEYEFNLPKFQVNPFLGAQVRKGYDFSEGWYAGVYGKLSIPFLKIIALTMFDKDFLTLSPRIRVGFFEFGYSLKVPINSESSGVDVGALHTVNLKFAL